MFYKIIPITTTTNQKIGRPAPINEMKKISIKKKSREKLIGCKRRRNDFSIFLNNFCLAFSSDKPLSCPTNTIKKDLTRLL